MTKRQIDRLLETAVAAALGITPARRATVITAPRGRSASARRTRRSRVLETA